MHSPGLTAEEHDFAALHMCVGNTLIYVKKIHRFFRSIRTSSHACANGPVDVRARLVRQILSVHDYTECTRWNTLVIPNPLIHCCLLLLERAQCERWLRIVSQNFAIVNSLWRTCPSESMYYSSLQTSDQLRAIIWQETLMKSLGKTSEV